MKKFLYRIGYLKKPIYTKEHDAVFRRTSKSELRLNLARSIFDDRDLIENYNESRMRDLKVLLAAALVLALLGVATYLDYSKTKNSSHTTNSQVYGNR